MKTYMKLKKLLFVPFLLAFSVSYSQYDPDYNSDDEEDLNELSFKDRLYTGGNFWAQFGTTTSLEISPILGYRVTNEYSVGAGIKYNYFRFRPRVGSPLSTSIYGGSVFTRYILLERFVAHAELEALSVELNAGNPLAERRVVPIGLVGGGYSSNGFQIMILYDVIGDQNNPYFGTFGAGSRVYLRTGFLFNL